MNEPLGHGTLDDPWIRRADLERVVDGDTYWMVLDLGYATYARHSIRLLGVDTPEIFSGAPEERARGQAAREFVIAWFLEHETHTEDADWPFTVKSEKDKTTFGRYLGDVKCRHGHRLAQALVDAGHVV